MNLLNRASRAMKLEVHNCQNHDNILLALISELRVIQKCLNHFHYWNVCLILLT